MSKGRRKIEEKPAAPTASFTGPAAIHSFLKIHAGSIALLVVLFATIRIVATYSVFTHTNDEPSHAACGLEWIDKGTYTWEPQHPPLARVATAIGPYLLGARSQPRDMSDPRNLVREGLRILYYGHHYDLTLTTERLGILPFFWIACLVVYEWGRRYFDPSVAVVAVGIFTFTPTVLAHAGLATTDMALTAFLGAAFLTGALWMEHPTTRRAALFGLCAGLAILSKFSSLVFFPAAAVLSLGWYLATERPATRTILEELRLRLPGLGLAALICCFTIWAGYRFSFGPVLQTHLSLPAPELFEGIREVRFHAARGHDSYLLGQRGRMGWWYFFPVLLLFKTPLAFLMLLGVWAVGACRKWFAFQRAWLPLTFAGGILLVGMSSTINIGLRHILPVYLAFSLMGSCAALWMLGRARTSRLSGIASGALIAWFAGSSLLAHPDYIPYFNELAGSHPENIAVDSDLDWGQDLKRLSRRLKEVGATEVTLLTPFMADFEEEHGIPRRIDKLDLFNPPQGWCAISITHWKNTRLGLFDQYSQYTIWPDRFPPLERVGHGFLLWYFPPNPVAR